MVVTHWSKKALSLNQCGEPKCAARRAASTVSQATCGDVKRLASPPGDEPAFLDFIYAILFCDSNDYTNSVTLAA